MKKQNSKQSCSNDGSCSNMGDNAGIGLGGRSSSTRGGAMIVIVLMIAVNYETEIADYLYPLERQKPI